MGWVRCSSIPAGFQSLPDLAQRDPAQLVLSRTFPRAGIMRHTPLGSTLAICGGPQRQVQEGNCSCGTQPRCVSHCFLPK